MWSSDIDDLSDVKPVGYSVASTKKKRTQAGTINARRKKRREGIEYSIDILEIHRSDTAPDYSQILSKEMG